MPTASPPADDTPVLLPTVTNSPVPSTTSAPAGLEQPTAQATGEITSPASPSETATASPLPTETGPATLTPTVTLPPTATPTATATRTPRVNTPTPVRTAAATPGNALTATAAAMLTPTRRPTRTPGPTATPTPTSWNAALTATYAATSGATTTATPTATPAQAPTTTPAGTPTPTLPAQWVGGGTPSPLQIDELAYAGSDGEYVVMANVTGADLSLAGWVLGDAEQPGSGEGMYALPDMLLAPGGLLVVARQADAFRILYGRRPDVTLESAGDAVPQLVRRKDLAKGKLALNDGGDAIVLLAPGLLLADAVAFGQGEYGMLGLAGELRAPPGYSLQRVPGTSFPMTADVRHRFLAAPPRPFDRAGCP